MSTERRLIKWIVILCVSIVAAVITAIVVTLCTPKAKRTEMPTNIDLSVMPSATIPEIQVESEYTINARLIPETAIPAPLSWSVRFADPNSAWAKGKTVNGYITITLSEDTFKCTVKCKQPFEESIIVQARCGNVTKECVCEFLEQMPTMTNCSISFGDSELTFNMNSEVNTWTSTALGNIYDPYMSGNAISADSISFGCSWSGTSGTIQDSYEYTYTFEATEQFKSAMREKGYTYKAVTGILDNGSIVTEIPTGFALGCYFPFMGMDGLADNLGDFNYIWDIESAVDEVLNSNPNMSFMKLTITSKGSRGTKTQTTYFKRG